MSNRVGLLVAALIATLGVVAPATAQQDRISAIEKGSVFILPKVEIRWDSFGTVLQNTFVHLGNDGIDDVEVQLYYINGDDPLPPGGGEPAHPGWNNVDYRITLTRGQPVLIDIADPTFLPFTVLDPPEGRPDPESADNGRMLRGAVVGWAVNGDDEQVRYNHLHASATVVDYENGSAWGYNAYHAQVVAPIAQFQVAGTPGTIALDGVTYAPPPAAMDFNFVAVSSDSPYDNPPVFEIFGHDADLSLLALDIDVRQRNDGPVTTLLDFEVWNENGTKFTGLTDCITCWEERLLSSYVALPQFTAVVLGTDAGRTRVRGVSDPSCPGSQAVPLLGVVARRMDVGGSGGPNGVAGFNGVGTGTSAATIRYDVFDGPPERAAGPVAPSRDDDRLVHTPPPAAALGGADRVDATSPGSVFLLPSVEIRFDSACNLVHDTFVHLTNTGPSPVRVQMIFMHGDPPLADSADESCGGGGPRPGYNWIAQQIVLGAGSPAWWSVADGRGAGVTPFTLLDPPFGRFDPATDERTVRGSIIGWAIDEDGAPIRWDHLYADATILDIVDARASGSNAYQFPANPGASEGDVIGAPGVLAFDGAMYGYGFDELVSSFLAAGSTAYSSESGEFLVFTDLDLTLAMLERNLASAPPTTRANFTAWNENEILLSGLGRCVTGWDQEMISDYGIPNYLLINTLQTDLGRLSLDMLANDDVCPGSTDATGLGVLETLMFFDGSTFPDASAAHNFIGKGVQNATFVRPLVPDTVNIDFDSIGTPPPTYAAADTAGPWQPIGVIEPGVPIEITNGAAPSGVILVPNDTRVIGSLDNPGTSGSDELLMDDLVDLGSDPIPLELSIYGLDLGTYVVSTYAWAPDEDTYRTEVEVDDATTGPVLVGGAWTGAFVEGTTHARHSVEVSVGSLTITATPAVGFGSINGIQIRRVICPADLDGDGGVGFTDLVSLLADWGPCVPPESPGGSCPSDLDGDGDVGFTDLVSLLADWGPC